MTIGVWKTERDGIGGADGRGMGCFRCVYLDVSNEECSMHDEEGEEGAKVFAGQHRIEPHDGDGCCTSQSETRHG